MASWLRWWRLLIHGVCFAVREVEVSCESVSVVIVGGPHDRRLGGNGIPGCAAAVALEEVFVPGRQTLIAFVEEAAIVAESLF